MGKPQVTVEQAEEFTASLGDIVGGSFRQIALADDLGIPQVLGLTLPEWVDRLGGYVKFNIEEKQKAVEELRRPKDKRGKPLRSQRKVAEILGTSQSVVSEIETGVIASDHTKARKAGKRATNAPTNIARDQNGNGHDPMDRAKGEIKGALDAHKAKTDQRAALVSRLHPIRDIEQGTSRLSFLAPEDAYAGWEAQDTVVQTLSDALRVAARTILTYADRVEAIETGGVRALRVVEGSIA